MIVSKQTAERCPDRVASRPTRGRAWLAVLMLGFLLSASPAAAEEYEPANAGQPVRVAGYLLHPVGVIFDFLVLRPAYWVGSARAVPQLFRPPGLIAPSAQSALSLGLASPGQRGQRCVQTTPGAPVLLASGFFPAFFCLALGPSLRLKQRRLLADLNFSQSQRNSLGLEQGLSGIWQQSGQTSPKSSGKHRNCIQRSRKWV